VNPTNRVTVAEIADLLAAQRALREQGNQIPQTEEVAFFDRKADLLARIAAETGSPEVAEVARMATEQATRVREGRRA